MPIPARALLDALSTLMFIIAVIVITGAVLLAFIYDPSFHYWLSYSTIAFAVFVWAGPAILIALIARYVSRQRKTPPE